VRLVKTHIVWYCSAMDYDTTKARCLYDAGSSVPGHVHLISAISTAQRVFSFLKKASTSQILRLGFCAASDGIRVL
jgi:hypothetical protein